MLISLGSASPAPDKAEVKNFFLKADLYAEQAQASLIKLKSILRNEQAKGTANFDEEFVKNYVRPFTDDAAQKLDLARAQVTLITPAGSSEEFWMKAFSVTQEWKRPQENLQTMWFLNSKEAMKFGNYQTYVEMYLSMINTIFNEIEYGQESIEELIKDL